MAPASDIHRTHLALAVGLVALIALTLLMMGRSPICECGYVKLWHGVAQSAENSQHLVDWYAPSHLIHGLLFYGVLWLVAPRLSLGARLLLALAVEGAWEIVENTEFVIDRYRESTVSLDYRGDSVINSVSDIIWMAVGFFLARNLDVWTAVLLAVGFELFTGWMIRDNLTLNVLMLLWPLEAVRDWQGRG